MQLASGLQFLRHQNVIHRDLKPANLLLSSRDPSKAKLVIADFGFARKLDDQSMASTLVGSPLYVAPELLDFKEYSSNADLWYLLICPSFLSSYPHISSFLGLWAAFCMKC